MNNVIICGMFLTIIGLAYCTKKKKVARRKRRWSVRPINKKRILKGHFHNLFYDMKRVDKEQFVKYIRMLPECFYKLLDLIQHKLVKCNIHNTILPEQRLVITLL